MSSRRFRARWVLPINHPPIANGLIEVARDRIVSVGRARSSASADDLGDIAVLPGLVNAHTHLELGWLAGKVAPAASLVDWIRALLAERPKAGNGEPETGAVLSRTLAAAQTSGTILVGEVSNTLATPRLLAAQGVGGVVFHELIGFAASKAAALARQAWEQIDMVAVSSSAPAESAPAIEFSVVAHAPYSVSPELFGEIVARHRDGPLSVHLAESAEEVEFLQTGQGPFRQLLEELEAWDPAWQPPRCDPAEYLKRVGYLRPGCLVVHGVHLTDSALELLREEDAILVTCPRSNEWVGAGMPPVARFYASGIRVAIGTDSLASSPSLNLFDELAALRRIAPEVAAASLLESATRVGADALGFGRDFGTIERGKRAALVGVRVPRDVSDVEEYLVSGVPAEDIRWVA